MDKESLEDKPMFSSSAVAEILQINRGTLKIYNEEGLLVPSEFLKKRKFYSLNDIKKGRAIRHLAKELKVNLSGVKIIFWLLGRLKIEPINYMKYIVELTEALK